MLRQLLYKIHPKFSLVRLSWLLELKLRNVFSNKTRVGFGPVLSAENNMYVRKWRIDPIVNGINKRSKKYVCDIFFDGDDLSKFDIVVMVEFCNISEKIIKQLKENNTILIYDIQDNPDKEITFIKLMDGIIIVNPLQGKDIQQYNSNFRLIEVPIINHQHKEDYRKEGPINILWDGFAVNMKFMNKLNLIIKKISKNTKHKINMIYHTNTPSKDEGIIKYVEWKLSDWEKMLASSDIAVTIKPLDDEFQQRNKPSAKVNTYRAAGLPVVCTPSAADKLVIKHGKTGYFAYTDEDWYNYLKKLIENPKLREKIGKAGRRYVLKNFDISKIAKKYTDFFDELIWLNRTIRQYALN
ncbi:glycosyltransferase [Candidatus Woesearchaeota archaeon]|nr:glycosyltransferase [Candidatus Woesearchaeota archaeon]